MDAFALPSARPFERLAKLREVIRAIQGIRDIREPLNSAEGLRQAVQWLLQLAEAFGVEPEWTDRLKRILDNDAVLRIVLAIVQYLSGRGSGETSEGTIRVRCMQTGEQIDVEAQSFLQWLPVVVEIMRIISQLRGRQ